MRKGIKISNDLRAWFINHLATAIDKVVASYDMQREQALAMMTPTFEDFVSGSTNAGWTSCCSNWSSSPSASATIKLVRSSSPLSYAFHLLCSFLEEYSPLSSSLHQPEHFKLVFQKHNHKQLENTKGAEDSPECSVLWRRLLLETLPLLKAFCFGFHEQNTATLCRRLDRLDAG